MYHWNTPIRYVKTIGPTRSKELTKIGVHTVGDLLEYPPLSWIYPGVTPISEAKEGMVVVKAKIKNILPEPFNPGMVTAFLIDKTGICKATWYGGYAARQLHKGMTATFYGKMKGGVLQQPKWTTAPGGMENVYGGQYGVHHDTIRAALKEVLANAELPTVYEGDSRVATFQAYHFPKSKDEQGWALAVLKQDESLTLQLALQSRRRGREEYTVQPMKWDIDMDTHIHTYFPYARTFEQKRTMFTVAREMQKCVPMSRLIHGEVGSGKTAVAFYAAMLAALNGKRTLILAPTTILASQHWDTLWNMGWDDIALYNTDEGKQSAEWYTANIIIGTHAMLNNESLLKSASLVIIDEFQKFGVAQRAIAQRHHPHLLLMSATPIPRSLAATVFGDLDVSTIRELPIKRGTVVTRWVLPEKREAMYEIIERELAKGHQIYVVYPRISGTMATCDQEEDVVSAVAGFERLHKRFKRPGLDLGFLTGKMGVKEKTDVLRRFKNSPNEINILVSTIIAEVGLDNPNATVMVIEGADRFGLSQLHQLRGRVCRSTDTAFCFLVSETSNPTSIARLEVIEKTNCGFEIAEEDLRLRGAGEVFSTRQTGLPDLRWCSLVDDYDLMIEAKETVASGSVGSDVRAMVELKYGDSLSLGEVV